MRLKSYTEVMPSAYYYLDLSSTAALDEQDLTRCIASLQIDFGSLKISKIVWTLLNIVVACFKISHKKNAMASVDSYAANTKQQLSNNSSHEKRMLRALTCVLKI